MRAVFTCHTTDEIDPVELVLEGELDAFTVPLLLEKAREVHETTGPVERIDCRSVTFMSAAGITALLQILEGRPAVIEPSPAVRRVFEIVGLEHLLHIESAS